MQHSERILFHEEQKFRQYWLWALLIGSFLFAAGIILMAIRVEPEEKRELLWSLAILLPTFVITFYLVYISKLETKVTQAGIYYRWYPIFRKFSFIAREEIEKAEIRKSPLGQYGFHLYPGYGRVHNVKGRDGVQFYLRSGKKIYLGTQDIFLFKKSIDQILSHQPKF